MKKLEGKVALVTGGNSGIGLAAARQLVADGAYVFITGRRQSELDAAVKQIGTNVTGIQGDVSNLADLDRLFAVVKEKKGHLDIVFANAAIAVAAPFGEITEEAFDQHFAINVKGALFTAQKARPLRARARRSSSTPRSWARRDWSRSVSTVRPRPRCGRSHAPGRPT